MHCDKRAVKNSFFDSSQPFAVEGQNRGTVLPNVCNSMVKLYKKKPVTVLNIKCVLGGYNMSVA